MGKFTIFFLSANFDRQSCSESDLEKQRAGVEWFRKKKRISYDWIFADVLSHRVSLEKEKLAGFPLHCHFNKIHFSQSLDFYYENIDCITITGFFWNNYGVYLLRFLCHIGQHL